MYVVVVIPRGSENLGRVIDNTAREITGRWGGCTMTEGVGYWTNPDTGLLDAEPVVEIGTDIRLSSETRFSDVKDWFDNLAANVRITGEQHTVYYRTIAGCQGRFIGPDTVVRPRTGEGR